MYHKKFLFKGHIEMIFKTQEIAHMCGRVGTDQVPFFWM